ncbi:hypothetical protein M0802_012136 [Mischocyttarus mexicanus]|nr:hypothetical protein M0802_012136 [Mischocyttarus mexicanus]
MVLLRHGSLTTEKLIRPDLPILARIQLHLYTMLLEKVPGTQGPHMFTDRYYTNFILAKELFKLKCNLIGTILTNRKHLPNQIKKQNSGLEICLIDSYIHYKIAKQQKGEQPLNHVRYVITLIRKLTGEFPQARAGASTLTSDSELGTIAKFSLKEITPTKYIKRHTIVILVQKSRACISAIVTLNIIQSKITNVKKLSSYRCKDTL